MDALLRVRRVLCVCSHSSLGSLCFSLIGIMGLRCPHLTISSTDKAAEGTFKWSHSTCADPVTGLLVLQAHTRLKTKAHSAHLCHFSDMLITALALWCYLRTNMRPHTFATTPTFPTTKTPKQWLQEKFCNLHLLVSD